MAVNQVLGSDDVAMVWSQYVSAEGVAEIQDTLGRLKQYLIQSGVSGDVSPLLLPGVTKEDALVTAAESFAYGTLAYAAAAGTLALALKNSGYVAASEKYLNSALKAWQFAIDRKNTLARGYMYRGKMVYYNEGMKLDGGNLLKAGAIFYALTGNKKYLAAIAAERPMHLPATKAI